VVDDDALDTADAAGSVTYGGDAFVDGSALELHAER